MKKLFAILILSISLIGIGNAQDIFVANGGFYWADSLYQDYPAVTDSTDSISYQKLGFNYDWMTITTVDSGGAGITDSCIVEFAMLLPDSAEATLGQYTYEISDTIWLPVSFVRDSSWTNLAGGYLTPSDGATQSFQIFVGNYDLIRIRMINPTSVAGRVWKFYAILSRKK